VALTADGPAEIALLPLPRLGFQGVRLTADDRSGPVLAEGGRLSIQLNPLALLSGRAEVAALALDGARLSLPSGEGDARWAGPMRRLSQGVAAEEADHPRRITLSRATVTGRDPRDGTSQTAREVDLTVSWPLWWDALDCAGSLVWNGATARFSVSGLHPRDLAQGRPSPFAASASWPAGSLSAEGSGSLGPDPALSGRAALTTRSLGETLAWIGGDLALSPLIEDIAADGRFELGADGLRLPSVRVSVGGTVLEGAGSASLVAHRAAVQATLASDDLNLSPLLGHLLRLTGLDGAGEGEEVGGASDAAWSRRPIALGPLAGGDLDLRISAGRARLGPMVMEDLASSVLVREGGIEATLNRTGLQGGTLKGRLALAVGPDPAETEIKAQGAFDGIDLGGLLIDLGQSRWVFGTGQGSVSLEGRGTDVSGLVRRVAGRVGLVIDGGSIAGLDLADVIQRGRLAPGPLARRNGRTPFERASLSVLFGDGVGEIGEGTLNARALTASLRGRISLPERRFLARAEVLPRVAAVGEGTPRPAPLFEIAGPWDAVAVKAKGVEKSSETGHGEPGGTAEPLPVPATAVPGLPERARAYAP